MGYKEEKENKKSLHFSVLWIEGLSCSFSPHLLEFKMRVQNLWVAYIEIHSMSPT